MVIEASPSDTELVDFLTWVFSTREQAKLILAVTQIKDLLAMLSNPQLSDPGAASALLAVEMDLQNIAARLKADYAELQPQEEALEQPKWGTSEVEIPILPITSRGVLIDSVTQDVQEIAKAFLQVRNLSPQVGRSIAATKAIFVAQSNCPRKANQ